MNTDNQPEYPIGERIKYFRMQKGYSTNKLANESGISQSYLRDIELQNKNPTIEIIYLICKTLGITLKQFFDDDTMSVHLKENVVPMAKKGKPGHIDFVVLNEKRYTYRELQEIVDEILDKAKSDPKTYLESDKEGSFVVQSREYRISIAYPPFSEALEITAVRPVANIDLKEYHLSDKLLERIKGLGLNEEAYSFYLDLRKYGSTRHAGFGLGFERCVMYLTGMSNIRDVIPFPRTVNNCEL